MEFKYSGRDEPDIVQISGNLKPVQILWTFELGALLILVVLAGLGYGTDGAVAVTAIAIGLILPLLVAFSAFWWLTGGRVTYRADSAGIRAYRRDKLIGEIRSEGAAEVGFTDFLGVIDIVFFFYASPLPQFFSILDDGTEVTLPRICLLGQRVPRQFEAEAAQVMGCSVMSQF